MTVPKVHAQVIAMVMVYANIINAIAMLVLVAKIVRRKYVVLTVCMANVLIINAFVSKVLLEEIAILVLVVVIWYWIQNLLPRKLEKLRNHFAVETVFAPLTIVANVILDSLVKYVNLEHVQEIALHMAFA